MADPYAGFELVSGPSQQDPYAGFELVSGAEKAAGPTGATANTAEGDPEVYRGTLLPVARSASGKVSLAVPEIVRQPFLAAERLMQGGYQPGQENGQAVEDAFVASSPLSPKPPAALLPAAGGRGLFGALPPKAGAAAEKAGAAEPPLAPGMVRMYHGGDNPDTNTPLWFSSDRRYAEGYATKDGRNAPVSYVDLPEGHPLIAPGWADQGIKQGFTLNRELPADIAGARKPLGGGAPAAEAAPTFEGAVPVNRQNVVEAGQRQGVEVPDFIASDSVLKKKLAGGMSGTPLIGDPITNATTGMAERMGNRMEALGGNATREPVVPGALAKRGISDWTEGGFRQAMNDAYAPLDAAINPETMVPLSRTAAAAKQLSALDTASASSDGQRVISLVREALSRKEGLSWEGLKELRTRVGERLYGDIAPEAGTSARALDKLYAALTEDVKFGVGRAGTTAAGGAGKAKALAAFEAANAEASKLFETRKRLTEIIGRKGDEPAESVFHRLVATASSTSRADADLLLKAKSAIGKDWNDVVSSVITRMGMDEKTKAFSPERFLTDYERRLSETGRNILFEPKLKAQLDDIATLSKAWTLGARHGNPSGSGRSVAITAAIAGWFMHPLALLMEVGTGFTLGRALSRPASAKTIADWMRSYTRAATEQTPEAAKALEAQNVRLIDVLKGGPVADQEAKRDRVGKTPVEMPAPGNAMRAEQGSNSMAEAPDMEGRTASNPNTGERMVFRGGQWVPLQ